MLYFNIFERSFVKGIPRKGVVLPRDIRYLRRIYKKNKEVIENYYLTRKFSVKNTNFISRMLEHMPLLLEDNLFEFMYLAQPRLEQLEDTFQITSGTNKGIVHKPEFYGNGGSDIIISEYDSLDVKRFRASWQTYPCLRTVTSPRNDFKLLLPTGIDDGSRRGIATVAIDMLALNAKYREFVKEQTIRYNAGQSTISKNVFVSKYVLPGFLESDIDHRLLNLVIDRFYGNRMIKPKFKHKTAILEPTTQLDRYADDVIANISNGDFEIVDIMRHIPLIFKEDASELLLFENVPNTRQSVWAFVVSRLKYMVFLYDIAPNKARLTKTVEDWKNLIGRFENDRQMIQSFISEDEREIRYFIDRIKNM